MLYTGKGDKGDTSAFGCKQIFSKNSVLAEALGSVDEINSFLGLCNVQARTYADYTLTNADKTQIKLNISEIIEQIQNDLFIIQANLAGADKNITQEKISDIEKIIDVIEKRTPPIKSFFIAGGTELSALFDYARAVSRRAERKAVAFSESKKNKALPRSEPTTGGSTTGVSPEILAYLNWLSSALYALSRICNAISGIKEKSPSY